MGISNEQIVHPETAELLKDLDCFHNNGTFDSTSHKKLILAIDKKLAETEDNLRKIKKILKKIIDGK